MPAFAAVIFAAPAASLLLFLAGTVLIGFGGGLFSVCTLTAAMNLERGEQTGLALGAWGAVQATAAGGAVALGGVIRDIVSALAAQGALGPVARLQPGLSDRNRPAVRGAGRRRAAGRQNHRKHAVAGPEIRPRRIPELAL